HASINFITAHDGFTLHDLVSYNEKHNEANLEQNCDGHSHNLSWNCGAEGPTPDPATNALRERQKRNMLATLLLSQGVPMLLAGDELGRTQQGNNNAYCQDNDNSWVNWDLKSEDEKLMGHVQRLIKLRRDHPVFRRRSFFHGRPVHGSKAKDIVWLTPQGREMSAEEWDRDFARCLGFYLAGDALDELDARGRPIRDASFLVLVNAHTESIAFVLPRFHEGIAWLVVLDTRYEAGLVQDSRFDAGHTYALQGRSLALLQELIS
ncbi:MAG: glycogen debranching protein GlgX, partial [Gammaproteobacteria bacterium]